MQIIFISFLILLIVMIIRKRLNILFAVLHLSAQMHSNGAANPQQ